MEIEDETVITLISSDGHAFKNVPHKISKFSSFLKYDLEEIAEDTPKIDLKSLEIDQPTLAFILNHFEQLEWAPKGRSDGNIYPELSLNLSQ